MLSNVTFGILFVFGCIKVSRNTVDIDLLFNCLTMNKLKSNIIHKFTNKKCNFIMFNIDKLYLLFHSYLYQYLNFRDCNNKLRKIKVLSELLIVGIS